MTAIIKVNQVNIIAAGLNPGEDYGLWANVALTEGGKPYFKLGMSKYTAGDDGTIQFAITDTTHPGWWSVYLYQDHPFIIPLALASLVYKV